MPESPTTEGSIVAYLRLDISDWETKLAEAESKARELGRISPDIRVSAETAEAIAKLRAVEEAAAAAGGDHVSHVTTVNSTVGGNGQDFTGATVGATALAEAIRRLDAASAELDVAQAADDEQMRQTSMQALKEAINMEALAAAESKASENAVKLSAAERLAADGANQQAAANGNNVSRMGLIVAAVAALIPMLAPLTGYATGVAGALAGMGAAGVLAILGIKNAMADGTAMGNTYSAGLQVLLGDLHQLEQTAASGVLNGFTTAVDTINSAMPELNREIGLFSTQLGITGNLVLNGVVTAFRILNPLFLAAGVYVEQLAAGFQSWTSDGGLQKFATMAMQDFPVVVQTLGSLAAAILNIINAFEPLGVASLNLLTVLGNVVSFLTTILGPAFAPVVLGATAAFVAFKQWQAIGPIIEQVAWKLGALGVAADAAAGPMGWVIGGVGLLAAALTMGLSATQQSTAAQEAYSAALQSSHGAIDQSIRDQVAQQLSTAGVLETAKQYHLALSTVTDAALGNADAQRKVTDAVNKYGTEQRTATAAQYESGQSTTELTAKARELLSAVTDQHSALQQQIKVYNDLAAAQGASSVNTGAELHAQQALAAQYGMSVPAFIAAKGAQQQNAAAALATTQQLQMENDAATLLTNAFTLLDGGTLTLMQAQTGAAAAGNTLLDSFKQNGLAIDGNTAKAVANQQAIEAKAQADQQAAEAIAKSTGSTEAGTKAFADSKTALEQELKAQGDLTPAVQAYIDKLYAIPTVVKTKAELDAAAAQAAADKLAGTLNALNGKSVSAQITTFQQVYTLPTASAPVGLLAPGHANGGPIYKAAGGMVDAAYLAGGGSPFVPRGTDTKPAMLTPGEFVVKAASAQAIPGFLPAYNDNPTRALQAVQASGGQQQVQVIITNKSGVSISDLIDVKIRQAGQTRKLALSAGRQAGTF